MTVDNEPNGISVTYFCSSPDSVKQNIITAMVKTCSKTKIYKLTIHNKHFCFRNPTKISTCTNVNPQVFQTI